MHALSIYNPHHLISRHLSMSTDGDYITQLHQKLLSRISFQSGHAMSCMANPMIHAISNVTIYKMHYELQEIIVVVIFIIYFLTNKVVSIKTR